MGGHKRGVLGDQVEPLLPDKSGDDRDERDILTLRERELALQRALAARFVVGVVEVKVEGEVGVGRGVVEICVDAVQDPGQPPFIPTPGDLFCEPKPTFWRAELFGEGWADRRNLVSGDDASFEGANDSSALEGVEVTAREVEAGKRLQREDARV